MKDIKLKASPVILALLVCLSANKIQAQDYIEKANVDSIAIGYKWSGKHALKKDRPNVLYLQISNEGTTKKLVSFELLYYQTGVLQSRSGIKEYCIRPGQTIRGKRWNLVFESESITEDMIEDPGFTWEFDNLTVEKSANCETGLRWRLAPEHPTNQIRKD